MSDKTNSWIHACLIKLITRNCYVSYWL